MKCPKCKNEIMKDSKFCDQCGYSFKKNKKIKLLFITVFLAIIGFSIGAASSYFLSPKYIARKYFNTVISNDTSKIYKYVDSKSPFITKELFQKKYIEVGKITDVEIDDISNEDDYILVTFKYLLDNNESKSYVKLKEKKFLGILTYYKVESGKVARNVKFRVLKGSKVTLDGEDISSYLKNSEENFDVYSMPDLVSANYNIKVEMPIGITVSKDILVSGDNTYTIAKLKLESDMKKNLNDDILNKLNILYTSSIDNKKYNDISDNFSNDLSNLYRSIKRSLNDSITSFEFSDITINSTYLNDDGMLSLEIFADYDIVVNGEEKSDYLSLEVIYSYDDNEFNLYDINNSYQVRNENYQ